MGKKSKANRKTAPVATAAATAAASATTTAAVAVATSAATATSSALLEEFPESTFLIKATTFLKKGNHSKAAKMFVQGIETGCVPCLSGYTMKILFDGATIENRMVEEYFQDNIHVHLALPLVLEALIRGSTKAVESICQIYRQAVHEEKGVPTMPLMLYWGKQGSKFHREYRTGMKQKADEVKELTGTQCSVCEKQDSETVTLMKCDGCKYFYYCSKECQKKMWLEGQHSRVCRHLGILNKYHKPFAKKIRRDIIVHRIAPRDIPELQELRQRLGLSRPQADYQELLEVAKAGRLDPVQLLLPRKDGTVRIGSFPRPI